MFDGGQVENQSALLEASDHGQVNVKLQPGEFVFL